MGNVLFGALAFATIAFGMANRRAFILLVVFVAGVPITLMTGSSSYFAALGGMAGVAVWLFVIVVGCAAALLGSFGRLHVVLARAPWLLLFLLFAAVSLSWTFNLLDGVRMLVKLAAPILFFWVILPMRHDAKFARRLESALYAGCLVAIAFATVNTVTHGALAPLPMKGGFAHLPAFATPYSSPANFSFLVMVGALAAYCRFLEGRKTLHLVLFGVFMMAVVLAWVRISLAGTLVGLAAVHLVRARPAATLAIAALALVVVAAVVTSDAFMERMFFVPEKVKWSEALTNPGKFMSYVNTSGRTTLWASAVRAFADQPASVGAGVGAVDTWINGGNAIATELHSEVFRVRLELGWAGLFLFLGGIVALWWKLVRHLRTLPRSEQSVALRASCGLFPAYLLTLLTDNTINYAAGFGVIVYGFAALALVEMSARAKVPAATSTPPGAFESRFVHGAAAIADRRRVVTSA